MIKNTRRIWTLVVKEVKVYAEFINTCNYNNNHNTGLVAKIRKKTYTNNTVLLKQ